MSSVALWPTRRRVLALAAAAVLPAQAAETDRFGALSRAARTVVRPERAVLLAGALAGERVVAVGERGVIALSDDGAGRWRQARSVPVSVTLTAVRFADAANGWAVGHGGVILATRDGGEHWVLQADGARLAEAAASAAAGLAADPRGLALAKEAELLVKDGPDKPLLDLHVVDARRVVVAGAYGLFFETLDGGMRWTAALDRLDNPKGQHLYALAVRGSTWLLAGEQGLLLRSTDEGRRFVRIASPYNGTWLAACATRDGEWVLAGLRGHAWRSTDDGQHWTRLEGAPPASLVSASALPDGGVLLANQAGQLFVSGAGGPLTAVPAPALPPLSQALPLPGGARLALGFGGAARLDTKA
ncbi:WD40/YVTN/BNR-like repeat-containing protein [Ideonella sp. YS5]|uniref:WD40/YVTN/BNR-like repeat-containing protein n=1 Tax=Ideonella sp. YS5 TaxID=3453714 RepID=UPI003EEFA86C